MIMVGLLLFRPTYQQSKLQCPGRKPTYYTSTLVLTAIVKAITTRHSGFSDARKSRKSGTPHRPLCPPRP